MEQTLLRTAGGGGSPESPVPSLGSEELSAETKKQSHQGWRVGVSTSWHCPRSWGALTSGHEKVTHIRGMSWDAGMSWDILRAFHSSWHYGVVPAPGGTLLQASRTGWLSVATTTCVSIYPFPKVTSPGHCSPAHLHFQAYLIRGIHLVLRVQARDSTNAAQIAPCRGITSGSAGGWKAPVALRPRRSLHIGDPH